MKNSTEATAPLITKKDLATYGLVETCKVKEGKLYIKITKGFDCNFIKTAELMKLIECKTDSQYPIIEKLATDDNLFECILTVKK